MELREFFACVDQILGMGYGRTLVNDHTLVSLGGVTAQQAIDRGDRPGDVWRELCTDLDLPEQFHWGLPEPKK
ncbi:Protein of unknown function [Micrococcales bacterium KH10]|nr:Protein of unknown function [Micrococcales bacterium KH10]